MRVGRRYLSVKGGNNYLREEFLKEIIEERGGKTILRHAFFLGHSTDAKNLHRHSGGHHIFFASRGRCLRSKQCKWLLQELCSSVMMRFSKVPFPSTQGSIQRCLPRSTLITIFLPTILLSPQHSLPL